MLKEVRLREREMGLEADWGLDGLMEAEARGEVGSGGAADLMLRMLGLGICADTEVGTCVFLHES